MTFTPTPKAELQPLTDLYEGWNAFSQQVLSRLHYADQAANWAAIQIAALYAALPDTIDEAWTYVGDDTSGDPGPQGVAVHVESDQSRTWALTTDGTSLGIKQGTIIVLTDDPNSPPVTAFRQYTVTSDPMVHGSWISFSSVRIATFGVLTTPAVGASVRLIIR